MMHVVGVLNHIYIYSINIVLTLQFQL